MISDALGLALNIITIGVTSLWVSIILMSAIPSLGIKYLASFSAGIRDYYNEFNDYVQTQIGNPDGEDLPNKKYYDPRRVLRQAEESFITRLEESFADLNCLNRN